MPRQPYLNAAGEAVPGVTTIINGLGWNRDILMGWANKIGRVHGVYHRKHQDAAANSGTITHGLVEEFLGGDPFDFHPWDTKDVELGLRGFDSFKKWWKHNSVEVIMQEVPLVSEVLQVGGCPDLICLLNGIPCILDWKTSRRLSIENVIQIITYWKMLEETHPELPLQEAHIIRLSKGTTRWAHYDFPNQEDLMPGFRVFWHLVCIERERAALEELV